MQCRCKKPGLFSFEQHMPDSESQSQHEIWHISAKTDPVSIDESDYNFQSKLIKLLPEILR